MKVAIVLINTIPGGSEKRIASLFCYLNANSPHSYRLIVPRGLHAGLCQQGILRDDTTNVVVIEKVIGLSAFYRLGLYLSSQRITGRFYLLIPFWRKVLTECFASIGIDAMDAIHYALPFNYLYHPPESKPPCIVEDADPTDSFVAIKIIKKVLRDGGYVNCLSPAIAAFVKRNSKTSEHRRVFASPGSFVNYRVEPKPRTAVQIAFVGRMEDLKNPTLFLHSIAKLKSTGRRFSAVMLGEGSLSKKVDALIVSLGLADVVTRTVHPRPLEVLNESLVFASLQRQDNYPSQSLLEAMLCGCAVVATDVGLTHLLVNDEVGFRVPPTPEAVAEKFALLIDNPDRAVALGRHAHTFVLKQYGIQSYAEYIEGLYSRVVADSNSDPDARNSAPTDNQSPTRLSQSV